MATAACAAGTVNLAVRNWVNNNALATYTLTSVCGVLSQAGNLVSTWTTTGTNNVVAAVDATKKVTHNLAGSGTPAICGSTVGVHTPNLKSSVGSFTFTPSFPGAVYAGTVGNVDHLGGANFGANSVCKVTTASGAATVDVSKCNLNGGKVTLTFAKDLSSVGVVVKVLNTAAWTATAVTHTCGLTLFVGGGNV